MKKIKEFCIPLHKSELLSDKRNESFSLVEVSVSEFPSRFSDLIEDLNHQGPLAITENFSTAFAIINKSIHDKNVINKMFKTLILSFQTEIKLIYDLLENDQTDVVEKQNHRNCVKIFCFLLCGIIEDIDVPVKASVARVKGKAISKNKKDIGKNIAATNEMDSIWLGYIDKYLDSLIHLFSIPIHLLWQPPILDEEFLRLIINFCFRLIENTSINRIKPTFRLITQLIGTIASKHNSLLGITLKILKTVQHIENQYSPMAVLVYSIISDHKCPQIIINIFKELSQIHTLDVSDNASSRNCAQFISLLGQLAPKEVFSNCSLLMCHLEWDPYSMRNAVLDCLGQILIQVYNKTELDEVSRKSRDSFLERIEQHLCDVNAYVRSHVLQIWTMVANEKAIPLVRFNKIAELTILRLMDKSCNVRKNAATLLHTLLLNNPYSSNLSINALQTQLDQEQQNLPKNIPDINVSKIVSESSFIWTNIESDLTIFLKDYQLQDLDASKLSLSNSECSLQESANRIIELLTGYRYKKALVALKKHITMDSKLTAIHSEYASFENIPNDVIIILFKTVYFGYVSNKIITNESSLDWNKDVIDEETKIKLVTINYLKDSLAFSSQIHDSLPTIYRLLQSDTLSDVLEVINFLVSIAKFSIASLVEIVDHILPLIWSNETSLKSTVIDSISSLIFNPSSASNKNHQLIIRNIFSVIKDAPIGRLSAIEELFCNFSTKKMFPTPLIKELWQLYSDATKPDRDLAIIILGMLSKGDPNIMTDNLEIIALYGFGHEGVNNINIAISSCNAIIKYYSAMRKTYQDILRHKSNTTQILKQLYITLVGTFNDMSNNLWSILCEYTMKIVVFLSDCPFMFLAKLMKQLLLKAQHSEALSIKDINNLLLIRILNAVGHCAASILFMLESDFLAEIKRRSQLLQRPINKKFSKKHKSISALNTSNALDTIEEDFNNVAPTTDETEIELIKDLCENELLHPDNFFYDFIPLVTYIIENNSKLNNNLVSSASLVLGKFMLLSSSFCSKNLQIIFTLLKKSTHENIKLNLIIIMGDIIQRFPNITEPWMPNFFSLLRDESCNVRKASLSVLSSLILNDMIKVKGHISELVLCIEDKDATISARTRLFFKELSLKDNAIYNIIPDIISRLSDSKAQLDAGLFERVMKFLLKFLQKEKQCESLVDKLCHRFTLAKNTSEILDIVFCLSQLSLGERSFKRLSESFATYKDKVYDDNVYEGFINIVTKFRKTARDEVKAIIDEYEKRLFEAHSRGFKEEDISKDSFISVAPKTENLTPIKPSPPPSRSVKRSKKEQNQSVLSRRKEFPIKKIRRPKKIVSSESSQSEKEK